MVFDRLGGFNTSLRVVDDTDWFLRAIEHGAALEILSDVLVYRRLHQRNLTRSALAQDELMSLLKKSLDKKRGDHRVRA